MFAMTQEDFEKRAKGRQISLGELMFWIAVLGLCLAAFIQSTPLGIVTSLILVPMLFRTLRIASRRSSRERLPKASFYLVVAFDSLVWVLATWAMASLAFCGVSLLMVLVVWCVLVLTSLGTIRDTTLFALILGPASLSAIAVFIGSARKFWSAYEWHGEAESEEIRAL
jgi:hypothetical protein